MNREEKQYLIEQVNTVSEIGEISDGFHTFNSLYNQRLCLWAALVRAYKDKAWKSRLHHDGEPCFGGDWFIVGITTPTGDYTYHYELKDWGLFDCKVLDKAPEFDGHTDKDVTRVLTLQPRHASQWIPVEKELPKYDVDENGLITYPYQEVLVSLYDGYVDTDTYDTQLKAWWKYEGEVEYWMPLPQPPRKED
jgi:hypothetical protein